MRPRGAVIAALALVLVLFPSWPASASTVTEHCGFSHFANDDPIVHPGEPGASHLHLFAGNPTTDAFSTPDSLLAAGQTTCHDQPLDFSGYWVPAVYVDGVQTSIKLSPYWKDNGVSVVAPPFGMEFVAGHDWGVSAVFACTPGGKYLTPPDCMGRGVVKLRVFFPSCWDGVGTSQADFAYPAAKVCPDGFAIRIPELFLQVDTKIVDGTARTFALASGADGSVSDYTTMHADFMDAWTPEAMQTLIDRLNAG
jgi:hypothetical protein